MAAIQWRPVTWAKNESITGIFLWILRNCSRWLFKKQLWAIASVCVNGDNIFFPNPILLNSQLASAHFSDIQLSEIGSTICLKNFLNYFCGMVDRRKVISFISSRNHCQEILTIANLRHNMNRIWTCVEPVYRLRKMKLCRCGNHYTTASCAVTSYHYLSELPLHRKPGLRKQPKWAHISELNILEGHFPSMSFM